MLFSLNRLRAAVKSGPPFVLFTISIFLLSLSALSVGLMIRSSNEPFTNPDVINWDALLQGISSLDLCLFPSNSSSSQVLSDVVSLSSPAVSLDLRETTMSEIPAVIEGHLPLKKIFKKPGGSSYHDATLHVSFSLNAKKELACLFIGGPSELLQDLKRIQTPSCEKEVSPGARATFEPCSQGTMRLSYTPTSKWVLTLSQGDVENIFVHLLWASGLLFSCSFFILLHACIRGVGQRDNHKFSSRRGDMELLRSDSPLD